jgi:hypothetical protein
MEVAVITGLAGVLVGLIPKIWDWATTGRRSSFIDDARDIIELMRQQGVDLKSEVVELRLEVQKLQALVGAFEAELVTLGADRDRINAIKYGVGNG